MSSGRKLLFDNLSKDYNHTVQSTTVGGFLKSLTDYLTKLTSDKALMNTVRKGLVAEDDAKPDPNHPGISIYSNASVFGSYSRLKNYVTYIINREIPSEEDQESYEWQHLFTKYYNKYIDSIQPIERIKELKNTEGWEKDYVDEPDEYMLFNTEHDLQALMIFHKWLVSNFFDDLVLSNNDVDDEKKTYGRIAYTDNGRVWMNDSKRELKIKPQEKRLLFAYLNSENKTLSVDDIVAIIFGKDIKVSRDATRLQSSLNKVLQKNNEGRLLFSSSSIDGKRHYRLLDK